MRLERIFAKGVHKVNVTLVSDKVIARFHKEYLGEKRATDVMSFKLGSSGEIVVSAETAARQAKSFGHTPEEEIFYLIIHGLLHLAGRKDDTEKARTGMERLQDAIFELTWKGI